MTPDQFNALFGDLEPYQRTFIRTMLSRNTILIPPRYGKRHTVEIMTERLRGFEGTIFMDELPPNQSTNNT